MMWVVVILALIGLAFKVWAAHRLKQFWHKPGAFVCLLFILITYAQTVLELYGYYVLYTGSYNGEIVLFKMYFVLVFATLLYLPVLIDVVILGYINLIKPLVCISIWAFISIVILSTNLIIFDIKALPQAFTRIPGPYYGVAPAIAVGAVLYSFLRLVKMTRSQENELVRTKAYNIVVGIMLLVITLFSVTILMRLGVPINMAGVLPFSIGIMILVIAEQFNDVRIFDLRAITPGTAKWRKLWQQTRHIHTVSVDPLHCRGLVDDYTDSLIEAAEKVCNSQRDIAHYVGVSQATVSRRAKKLSKKR